MAAPIPEDKLPDDKLADIKAAIFRGRKIEAIRLHRECTGMGLAESKDAVETLEANLRSTSPHEFAAAATASGRGCLGVVLALCTTVVAIAVWLVAR